MHLLRSTSLQLQLPGIRQKGHWPEMESVQMGSSFEAIRRSRYFRLDRRHQVLLSTTCIPDDCLTGRSYGNCQLASDRCIMPRDPRLMNGGQSTTLTFLPLAP